jgi:hypothetical protein
MTVVDLTFVCERLSEHPDGQVRTWQAQGQERIMEPITQELTPVVLAPEAMCPTCFNTGVADYPTTVYVIPDDDSEQAAQINDAIEGAS